MSTATKPTRHIDPSSPTHRRRLIGGVLAVTCALAACGVPAGSDSFEQIPDDEIPGRLADPTTTTSSTTTTTTVPTTTTAPEAPEPTLATTTTIVQTQDVFVYFISRGQLKASTSRAPAPVAASELISLLEAGPVEPFEAILDSFVTQGLIIGTTTQGGVITIDIDADAFDRIRERNQDEAIAQIVLTVLSSLAGVGQATFTFDGEPLGVPTANPGITDQPVSKDDYAAMVADGDPLAVPEATTTTTTTTTVPTPDDAAPTTEL